MRLALMGREKIRQLLFAWLQLPWSLRLFPLLVLLLLVSAQLLVQITHQARTHQVRLQTLEGERDALQVEWGRLLLEESVLATPIRLEQLGAEYFQLELPERQHLKIQVVR